MNTTHKGKTMFNKKCINEEQVREFFWELFPKLRVEGYTQNDYNPTIRTLFCHFVDGLHENGDISDELANEVTL